MSGSSRTQLIGVLALQGAFEAHERALRRAADETGVDVRPVRTPADLELCDGLVMPGGESTAIRKGLAWAGLYEPLRARLESGMPTLATCAGLVILAVAPEDAAPPTYGLLDVDVVRNGFGRQLHSSEASVDLSGTTISAVFIRAPRIGRVGAQVDVIGRLAEPMAGALPGEAVAVRQGNIIGLAWHPELGTDLTIHREFIKLVERVAAPC